MATSIEETAVAEEGAKGVSRRGFLTGGGLIAGAAVMAGLAGCAPAGKGELASTGEAVPKAKGHVVHQQYICSGCRTCELTCVLSHEQLINPAAGPQQGGDRRAAGLSDRRPVLPAV